MSASGLSRVARPGTAVALALLALLATQYRDLLSIPLVSDYYLILDKVQDASFWSLWSPHHLIEHFYRPWSREFHYWGLERLFGLDPAPFHAASIVLWLAAMGLFFSLARRVAGDIPAAVATLGTAASGAWGVLLTWPAGSQDLWMITAALGSLLAFASGRTALSAAACVIALLSKETAALLPAIVTLYGLLIARLSPREVARRTAPHWGLLLMWAAIHPRLGGRLWAPLALSVKPAPGHLPFVALRTLLSLANLDTWPRPAAGWVAALAAALPAALIFGAVVFAVARSEGGPPVAEPPAASRKPQVAAFGAGWALLGWLPLLAPGLGWHGYYASFGALGAWLAGAALIRRRVAPALALVVAIALLRPARVSTTEVDIGSEWYQRRIAAKLGRLQLDLLSQHPRLPSHSRVYFGDVPSGICLIAGFMDSPALRVWYHDRTLRGGFPSHYRVRAADDTLGRDYFFAIAGDSLRDKSTDPDMLVSFAYSMFLGERPSDAVRMLDLAIGRSPADHKLRYWRAWARWAVRDTAGARDDLERTGIQPGRALPADAEQWVAGAGRDTTRRIERLMQIRGRAGLSPWVHARLAALSLRSAAGRDVGTIEAYAYQVLAPDEPDAWRKWASAQIANQQYEPALQSLEHYLRLAGARGERDREAQQAVESLRGMMRGMAPRPAASNQGGDPAPAAQRN